MLSRSPRIAAVAQTHDTRRKNAAPSRATQSFTYIFGMPRTSFFGTPCAIFAHRIAALALATSLFVLSGCSGGCSREKTPEPILDRMQDPAYVEQLKERLNAQHELAAQGSKVLRELEAARAEDPESEKTKELEKRHAEISAELEKQRIINMAIIRERIAKEQADKSKASEKANGGK